MRVAVDARKIADFGIGTYIRGLLGGLVALDRGDEIVALAPADAELPPGVEHAVLEAPHYSARELIAVGRAARQSGAELLHAPHYVTPLTPIPLVVTVHDLIHLHHPPRNPLAPLYARAMIGRAVRKARRVLTVSETVRRQLIEEIGARPERVIVAPNGVSMPATAPVRSSARPFFLYAGNDKPHKNVDGLVRAFERARRRRPDLALVLAGAPFERFRGREGVSLAGFVARGELEALYRDALAVVVPSHEEGFGLPALEAMAQSTAVITSLAPALVEITGDGALHADAADAESLGAAMVRLAKDDALRARLASRGAERARAFTWRRCAEITRGAYEAALAGR